MKDCDCNKSYVKAKFDSSVEPSCEQTAVIPMLFVDNTDGIKGLSNCLIRVSSTNSIYYVDSRHAIMPLSAGVATVNGYDTDENELNLRNQFAYDSSENKMYYFDIHGELAKTLS